jgi:uncharacterized protein (TIGR00288 family)
VIEERLKLAVFIDFDNIQIGVKDTLGKEFDVSLVLEALKERGEVVTKVAYGDWPRASEQSRDMTQHAVQMVQRNVTPRGDKNGADINLALDAIEMAFNRPHINAFAIVGGDSDFIALVEKLKQYDKRVFVVGGRAFTSNILQRNCTEFIAYENLLRSGAPPSSGRGTRSGRRGESRGTQEVHSLAEALPNVQRALKILAEREVSPQLGLLKSTLLQLDSTFTERDYGTSSFLEFMQKMEQAGLVHLRKTERGFVAELPEAAGESVVEESAPPVAAAAAEEEGAAGPIPPGPALSSAEAMGALRQALANAAADRDPNRPLYVRHIRQGLRAIDKQFDERRAGFHGIVDFLQQAQREGWLRLQRDRRGALRILPATPAETAPESAAEARTGEPAVQGEATASTDFWASPETVSAEELTPPLEPEVEAAPVSDSVPEATETAATAEAAAEPAAPRKGRRGRTKKAGTPGTSRRRTSSRRKPAETTEAAP